MLTLRPEQLDTFERYQLQKFEDEMVEHSKEFSPDLCKILGDDQVRVSVRAGIQRADAYRFTNRGPIRLFIELRFLFGSAFDTDPQYPWASEVLSSPADQMERAQRLQQKTGDFQENVFGPGATNAHKAEQRIKELANQPLALSVDDYADGMIKQAERIFPEKAAYIGEAGIRNLIAEAKREAQRYSFASFREQGLLVVLMFAFGHGCTDDPLYPWISRTLKDPRIKDSSARADRLERKALTWLDHILASPAEGAQG